MYWEVGERSKKVKKRKYKGEVREECMGFTEEGLGWRDLKSEIKDENYKENKFVIYDR